jgi:lysyl-tRNA synthetase class 2
MSTIDEVTQERRNKRDVLKAAGMEPYTATANPSHTNTEVLADFDSLKKEETSVTVAGRIMALRLHGGMAFADIFDGTDKLQLFFSKDALGEDLFNLFFNNIDSGDFIEATGVPFVTKRETQAIGVTTWRILTKSLQPIPTEHFGIKDEDMRYRKRYLDILLDSELRETFAQKAKFWDVTRAFMKEQGFLEVETPTLEVTTGGAEARPFATHHNDFDMPVFMRISVGELWQKRLMAAGFPKVFEIGRVYRNEGTSPEHLQEFTNLEFYWAYADYRAGMKFVQDLYRKIATEVFGTTKFSARGHDFDLASEWKEIDYVSEVETQTGINIITATDEEMKAKLSELNVKYDGANRERLTDTLWKYCRKNIAGPAFLINHPKLIAPLAKTIPGTETVEMFQPIIAGSEVGRGYSELNDPDEQRARFEEQKKLLDAGDDEAMMPDYEFVEMLEHGMPPTCGFGFGERLFAFLAGKPLREVQLFPLMRPKGESITDEPEDSLEPGCCEG